MGGSDNSSNLVEVTIEEHAELHLALYLEHGRKEDWYAFMGLSEQIGKEDIFRALMDPTGRTHSEETKEKMRHSQLGKKKHTPESKKKISEARRGKKLTEEHKRKIGEASKGNKASLGKKLTEEQKKTLSNKMKGNKNWSKNPKVSEEARRNRSEAVKKRWAKYREEKGLPPK
jgi:hypothetical protein